MRQRLDSDDSIYSGDHPSAFPSPPPCNSEQKKLPPRLAHESSLYNDWLASRVIPRRRGALVTPGAQRPFNSENSRLAYNIIRKCAFDLFCVLWSLHPYRTGLMISIKVVRGLLPVCRGYSQALIVDEIQSMISSGRLSWPRLVKLLAAELVRRVAENALDSFATENENFVLNSARFFVEYQQMAQRVKLDIPTLSDPVIRDLLQESDLFVRSFHTMGGFGLLSPFDFFQILALLSELLSHVWMLLSMTGSMGQMGALFISIISSVIPLFLSWCKLTPHQSEAFFSRQEMRANQRQERYRNLAYNESHRPEIILFGLGPWILQSWTSARKAMLDLEKKSSANEGMFSFSFLSQINVSDLLFALQNIPLVLILQSSSASLGSLTLYRNCIQSVIYTTGHILTTTRMAFQSIFLMAAFCAAMEIQPRLKPKPEETVQYQSSRNGAKIEARNLYYTYPGSKEPTLRNVNFTLEAGEILAIVGYNGSGKSTLANILLRILDFDSGGLFVNDIDIRSYDPADYHRHITTVFQGFSKFNSSVRENVGIGCVEKMSCRSAINKAVHLAGADEIIHSLPEGLKTKLDCMGSDPTAYSPYAGHGENQSISRLPQGLSGGEWQRIAISRAFMRAEEADVDLLIFDEPTSSLDAHAQKHVFDTIESISRPSGQKAKTVVFITHRLSTARRADKIAMMEHGTITEFGTHEELLRLNKSYASLYQASV